MKCKMLALFILAFGFTACAARRTATQSPQTTHASSLNQTRRTLYIPVMDGYEKNVVSALNLGEVPVQIVTEQSKADLQVKPTLSRWYPGMPVAKGSGHGPFSYFDVVEVETHHTLLSYPFLWTDYEVSRYRDAQEFARELKKKLTPKSK
jgi:hypothetical protein